MKYFFPLLLLCLTQFTFADQLIIEPERGRAPLIEAMNGAHHTIHLVMYGFTDKTLLNTLLWQKRRGITTEVLLENNPYRFTDQNNATIAQLNSNHVALQQKAAHFYLVHQKTLIIDDKEAIVMTFNFTQSTFKRTRNFALVVTDPQLVHDINAVFLADWQHKPTPPHAAPLIYSPDDSREKLIAAIHTAKHSLKIYAQTVSDYAIIRALADAANHGVQVVILTSNPIQAKKVALLKCSIYTCTPKHG